MVGHNYDCLAEYTMRGYINWNTGAAGYNPSNAIYVALLKAAYTPSHSHKVWADVSAQESVATGYTSGGQAVTLSNTYTITGGAYPYVTQFMLTANPTWTITSGTLDYAYAAYYINATVNSIVKPLLSYQALGSNTCTNGVVTLTEPAVGPINIQAD
jgi:hypothetical protein